MTEPPGIEAPLHVHQRDDEGFWISRATSHWRSVTRPSRQARAPTSSGRAASRIASLSAIGAAGCCHLVPGGIEDVIRVTSEPALSRTLPPPPEEEPTSEEIEGLKAMVKEHGYELLV